MLSSYRYISSNYNWKAYDTVIKRCKRWKSTIVEKENKKTIVIIRAIKIKQNKEVETKITRITKKNKTILTLRLDDM